MKIAGAGLIGKVPFDVSFAQDFGTDPGPAKIDGTVTLSQKAVEEFGLGLPKSMVSGEGPGQVAITLPRGAPPRLVLTSDLRGITLALPELGWRKTAGATGRLEAEVTLGSVPDVTALKVSGAGLSAVGRVKLKGDGGLGCGAVLQGHAGRLAGWRGRDQGPWRVAAGWLGCDLWHHRHPQIPQQPGQFRVRRWQPDRDQPVGAADHRWDQAGRVSGGVLAERRVQRRFQRQDQRQDGGDGDGGAKPQRHGGPGAVG